jgi:hypothetical protein
VIFRQPRRSMTSSAVTSENTSSDRPGKACAAVPASKCYIFRLCVTHLVRALAASLMIRRQTVAAFVRCRVRSCSVAHEVTHKVGHEVAQKVAAENDHDGPRRHLQDPNVRQTATDSNLLARLGPGRRQVASAAQACKAAYCAVLSSSLRFCSSLAHESFLLTPSDTPSPRRGGPSPFQDDDGDADLLMALCGRRRNGYGLVASVHCVWRLRWKEERPGSSCHAKQR